MITIKRNGAMHYYGICPECNAQLEFNKTDIINEKIWCPQCGTESEAEITVKLHNEIQEEIEEMTKKAFFACSEIKAKSTLTANRTKKGNRKKIWQKWKSK